MRINGVSCAAGNIEKHVCAWTGNAHRTGSVHDSDNKRYDALLGLNQGASKASKPGVAAAADGLPAADGGGGTDAAGSPAADGVGGTASGGGVTDAEIEFTRKISALEAQVANLEDSLRSLNSKFSSILTSFNHFASSLPTS